VSSAVGGEATKQAHVLEAIMGALERGAGADEAVAVAREAAASWRGWNVVAQEPATEPVVPAHPDPAPIATAQPASPARRPMAEDPRLLFGLIGAGLVAIAGILAVLVFQPGTPTEAQKSADQIFSDSKVSLGLVASYHAVVRVKADGKSGSTDMYFQDKDHAKQDVAQGAAKLQVLATSGKLYARGNADFYSSQPVLAQHAADQWLQLAPNSSILDPADFTPDVGASCVFDKHGKLTKKGVSTIGDRKVVEIDDKGDKPGSTPAKFFIAAEGRADLVRVQVTGPTTAGAFDEQCVRGFGLQTKAKSISETIELQDLNGQFDIPATASSLNLDDRPFCGVPLDPNLGEAAKQYLLIAYDGSLRLAKAESECGCPTPTTQSLRLAWTDEAASDEDYVNRIQQLPVDATQKAAVNAAVAAYQKEIRDIRARIAGTGDPNRVLADDPGVTDATRALRAALGLPAGTCSYNIPP
jgi:hypothetical protein